MCYWGHSITTVVIIILELHRTVTAAAAAAVIIDQYNCFLLEFLKILLLGRCCQIQRLTKTKEK